ncbi:HAD family hydrolase [Amnibacterium kyonggiense]|uniref:Putative hydrolase of the HAD superfamily n=1 Tax=Amnibacterium kyonggiense TaxID=595671 RepID=A0A4R7FPB0_9MICO|nr:HAD family hydrolase [Amnibacterium kyonggiense]TDS79577.1 putative hydrolase of the HAD superfamily [Amnibacterium kyonggiense]
MGVDGGAQERTLALFDLDGTLLDGSGLPGAMRATCTALAAFLPGIDADALVRANTAAWERLWPEVEDDWMLGGRSGLDVGRDVWRAALEACGATGDDVVDRAVLEWDRQERAALRLFPDAVPTLDGLAAQGVRIGMVTNGAAAVQRDKLAGTGILDRFDPLIVSSEVGVKKPDPAIFEVALAAAGVTPAEAWFVGDHLWHDAEGALRAGLRAIWLDRRGVALEPDWPRPDAVVTSLTELLPPAAG